MRLCEFEISDSFGSLREPSGLISEESRISVLAELGIDPREAELAYLAQRERRRRRASALTCRICTRTGHIWKQGAVLCVGCHTAEEAAAHAGGRGPRPARENPARIRHARGRRRGRRVGDRPGVAGLSISRVLDVVPEEPLGVFRLPIGGARHVARDPPLAVDQISNRQTVNRECGAVRVGGIGVSRAPPGIEILVGWPMSLA